MVTIIGVFGVVFIITILNKISEMEKTIKKTKGAVDKVVRLMIIHMKKSRNPNSLN